MPCPAGTPIPVPGVGVIALDPMNQSMNPIVERGPLMFLTDFMRFLHLCAWLEIASPQQIE